MSTSKRPRTSRIAGPQRSSSPAEPPVSKRRKPSHVSEKTNGLDFLVDEQKRAGKTVKAQLTNGVSRSNGTHLDDSHALVAQNGTLSEESELDGEVADPQEVIDISSGAEESSDVGESDDDADAQTNANVQLHSGKTDKPLTNGHLPAARKRELQEQGPGAADDEEMEDVDEPVGEAEEPASFGELLQARHPEPIDMRRALQQGGLDAHALTTTPDDAVIPTGHSLRTALSQALKNNDRDLLEACFAITNPTSIRVTIQRLKSHDVATLLERIAERIYKSPGRTGPLMVWVQWALVDHGGYLANQPELMQKLRKLSQVVRERASGLLPLLHLKGKLDLLCAQLQHRRDLQAKSRAVNMEDPDDDRDVLYVEGQDDDLSEDSDAAVAGAKRRKLLDPPPEEDEDDSDDEDETGHRLANGLLHDLDDESSAGDDNEDDDEDREPNDMLDIEAEEGSEEENEDDVDEADSASEEEEDEEDEEEEESGNDSADSSEIAVAPRKLSTLNRKR